MARKPPATSPPFTPTPEPTTTNYPTGSQQGTPTMSNFADILNAPVDQIEAPKVTPAGSYVSVVDGNFETGESNQKKTPYVRIKFKLLQAQEDVNQEELRDSKAIGKTVQTDFYMTEDAAFRLKEFLVNVLEIQGTNLREMLAQIPGKQCIVVCRHELTRPTDGSEPRVIARYDRFLKV